MFLNCLFVGIGGFVGAICRYLCSFIPQGDTGFPFVTLGINIVGSFILAFLATLFLSWGNVSEQTSLLLRVGFCGSFTTFSTFALESVGLFNQGNVALALVYIVLSVILCIAASFAGTAAAGAIR